MKQTLLRTYVLYLTANLSWCYTIPSVDFIVYPKGFSISIPDEQGIELIFFDGSVDTESCNFQTNNILLSSSKCNGEKWVLENTDVSLAPGQLVYYWLYVKKDGVGYIKHGNIYNVTDIRSYKQPDETLNVDPTNVQADTDTRTRLSFVPFHVKPILIPPGTVGNLPPHVQKLLPNLQQTKPRLNLDPYPKAVHPKTPTTLEPVQSRTPLNLDPGYLKTPRTERPSSSVTQRFYNTPYFSTSATITWKNCSALFEGEPSNSPLPIPLNYKNNSKETDDRCHFPLTNSTTRFIGNSDEGKNRQQPSSELSSKPPIIKPNQETWLWNRK